MGSNVNRQRGVTLMEMMVALTIGLILTVALATAYSNYAKSKQNSLTADWVHQFGTAANHYISDNAAALAAGGTVTYAQLSAGGYLPTGFAATNPFGGSATVQVVATGGKLNSLVCVAGGNRPTGLDLRDIAGSIGLGGGWVDANNPSVAVGKAWGPVQLSTYGLSSGACWAVDALFVEAAASVQDDDYLHRDATAGHPELNRMNTAIDMNSKDINNANNIKANDLITPAGNGVQVGQSFFYGGSTGNAAIRTPGAVYIDNQTGSAGADIARVGNINSSGRITAPNWFYSTGNTGWYNSSYGGGWYMTDTSWIRAYNNKGIVTSGEVRGGTIHSTGNVVADGSLVPNGKATVGAGCATKGAIAQSSSGTGQVIQCKSGVWSSMGGFTSYTIVTGPNTNYQTQSVATCPSGYTLLSGGHTIASNPYGTLPGVESRPLNSTQWGVTTTDSRIYAFAVALCAK